jgi:hypothetical protein
METQNNEDNTRIVGETIVPNETKEETETFDVLYNCCYGGFGISKEALKRYNEKLLKKNPKAEIQKYDMFIKRTDPILLEVFYEMDGENSKKGEGFNDKYSKVVVAKLPIQYRNFYDIEEYDGKEGVSIDYNSFSLWEIKNIAKDESLSYEERILKIQNYKVYARLNLVI